MSMLLSWTDGDYVDKIVFEFPNSLNNPIRDWLRENHLTYPRSIMDSGKLSFDLDRDAMLFKLTWADRIEEAKEEERNVPPFSIQNGKIYVQNVFVKGKWAANICPQSSDPNEDNKE